MIPLVLLALGIYIPGTHLYLELKTGNLRSIQSGNWDTWVAHPASAPGKTGEVLRYTLATPLDEGALMRRFEEVRRVLLERIQRRLTFLQTLVTAAPLLGLLGTVIGMFDTFTAIGSVGGDSATRVAAGISTALITTQTGLFIALPGLFLVLLVRRRKQAIEAVLARLEGLCLAHCRRARSVASSINSQAV